MSDEERAKAQWQIRFIASAFVKRTEDPPKKYRWPLGMGDRHFLRNQKINPE